MRRNGSDQIPFNVLSMNMEVQRKRRQIEKWEKKKKRTFAMKINSIDTSSNQTID
jgi:hypothetical protein